jgi:hypothetical protein
MSSQPSCYKITIAGGGSGVPGEGFVDNRSAASYLANATATGNNPVYPDDETSLDNLPPAFNLAGSFAKKRANIRYNAIVAQLGLICNVYIQDVLTPGASAGAAASSFNFTALVEHGNGSLRTWDEVAPGVLITDPVQVLTRAIARALSRDLTMIAEVLDPTPANSLGVLGASRAVPRFGIRTATLQVGRAFASLAAASSAITIVPVF